MTLDQAVAMLADEAIAPDIKRGEAPRGASS